LVNETYSFLANNKTAVSYSFSLSHKLCASDLAIFPRLPSGFGGIGGNSAFPDLMISWYPLGMTG